MQFQGYARSFANSLQARGSGRIKSQQIEQVVPLPDTLIVQFLGRCGYFIKVFKKVHQVRVFVPHGDSSVDGLVDVIIKATSDCLL